MVGKSIVLDNKLHVKALAYLGSYLLKIGIIILFFLELGRINLQIDNLSELLWQHVVFDLNPKWPPLPKIQYFMDFVDIGGGTGGPRNTLSV